MVRITKGQEILDHLGLKESYDVYLDSQLTFVISAESIDLSVRFQYDCMIISAASVLNGIMSETSAHYKLRNIP